MWIRRTQRQKQKQRNKTVSIQENARNVNEKEELVIARNMRVSQN